MSKGTPSMGKKNKRPISDAEDVVKTLITFVKKSVLLAVSVNPVN